MLVNTLESNTFDEFVVKVLVKALWKPTGTQPELSHIIDDILRVGGFDAVDPIVLGSHIKKDKVVSENPRAIQPPKTIYPWNLSRK